MSWRLPLCALFVAGLGACGPNYSPNTYSTSAVQQANKVEQGVIVGVRNVQVTASGAVGTVSGAAAGGIAGAQVGSGPISALSALGGSLVGGLAGTAVEHATADTSAFEYIVRKSNNELVSVTQKDKTALTLGLHVLVIAGNQARIVPDYTVAADLQPKPEAAPTEKPRQSEPDKPASSPAEAAVPPSGTGSAGTGAGAAAPSSTATSGVPGSPLLLPTAGAALGNSAPSGATDPRSGS